LVLRASNVKAAAALVPWYLAKSRLNEVDKRIKTAEPSGVFELTNINLNGFLAISTRPYDRSVLPGVVHNICGHPLGARILLMVTLVSRVYLESGRWSICNGVVAEMINVRHATHVDEGQRFRTSRVGQGAQEHE
jgi:hypothetical protein